MGLLLKLSNGDTTLKSLKFGSDLPGGGDSNQPFIQKDIDNNEVTSTTPDFILRGGHLTPEQAADDVSRLTKFFQTPEGINFILKQNILSKSNVKTDGGNKFIRGGVYTPLSTLTQAGIGFTGTHVNKQGIDPLNIISSISQKEYIGAEHIRLKELYTGSLLVKNDKDSILTYGGGPGSVLGVGKTRIKYATDSTGENPIKTGANQLPTGSRTLSEVSKFNTGSFISEQLPTNQYSIGIDETNPSSSYIVAHNEDNTTNVDPTKGKTLSEQILGEDSYLQSGSIVNFRNIPRKERGFDDKRNPRITTKPDYITGSFNESDTLIDNIYYDSSSDIRESNKLGGDEKADDDYIPFNIQINNGTTLRFRAYLDDISDSYNAGWNSQSYMGRAEKFYKYNSFDRDISFGFTIVSDNKINHETMYDQLNTLASSLAPTYQNGYMSGNLHRLTIGDYLKSQWGIIHNLTYNITTESPWGLDSGYQTPYYIKVSGIKFTPIHTYRPQYGSNFQPIG